MSAHAFGINCVEGVAPPSQYWLALRVKRSRYLAALEKKQEYWNGFYQEARLGSRLSGSRKR